MTEEQTVDAYVRYAAARGFIEECLYVRDKGDRLVKFEMNHVQREILLRKEQAVSAGRSRRFLILKARRMGVTTLEQALNFRTACSVHNAEVLTLAHDIPNTEKMFRIANLFYERLNASIRPARLAQHSKRELNFPQINSLFSIATAGSRAPSRGSTLSRVHWAEVAWSPGEISDQHNLLVGLTEAASHGDLTLESTPNGVGNLFHGLCVDALKGVGPWTLIFVPWYSDPSYTVALDAEGERLVVESYTEEEKALVEKHSLAPQQIAWRRQKISDLTVGGDARLFAQEYPEDPETCFLVSGLSFFDVEKVQAIIRKGFPQPIEQREISGDRPGTGGRCLIYAKAEKGKRYAVGCDTAGGSAAGNESVAAVLEVEKCAQVAVLRGRWKPEDFARLAARLAHAYNNALLCVEANNHGHSCLNTLVNEIHYPNLYHAVDYASGKRKEEPGFTTDGRTRPVMLGELRQAVETGWMAIADRILAEQCLTFKLDRDAEKYKAAPGCLDDTVIAWAIALQSRKDPDAQIAKIPQNAVDLAKSFGLRMFPSGERRLF